MNRILVIRLGAMGDIVLATAAVEALSRAYPKARIEFLIKERFTGLLERDPRISRLWRFEDSGRHRGTRGMLTFMRDIQQQRFDLAVDLQGNIRSQLICRCLRSKSILRWDKQAWRRRLTVAVKKKGLASVPVYRRYLDALAPLNIVTEGIVPRLNPADWDPPHGLKGPFVAMAPGAHWPAKRWPSQHYAALSNLIAQRTDLNIALVGSADDGHIAEQIQETAGAGDRVIDLSGQFELGQLAGCLARARALVTNDTGPMHLAEAVGTPVLAFFGPTVKSFGFAPWRKESRVLERDLKCRPCSLHGRRPCRRRDQQCLSDISPEETWRALEGILHG